METRLSDPMVLSNDEALPAVDAVAPVLGRRDRAQSADLPNLLETRADELPGTRSVRANLAPVLARTTAGAIEHSLGVDVLELSQCFSALNI